MAEAVRTKVSEKSAGDIAEKKAIDLLIKRFENYEANLSIRSDLEHIRKNSGKDSLLSVIPCLSKFGDDIDVVSELTYMFRRASEFHKKDLKTVADLVSGLKAGRKCSDQVLYYVIGDVVLPIEIGFSDTLRHFYPLIKKPQSEYDISRLLVNLSTIYSQNDPNTSRFIFSFILDNSSNPEDAATLSSKFVMFSDGSDFHFPINHFIPNKLVSNRLNDISTHLANFKEKVSEQEEMFTIHLGERAFTSETFKKYDRQILYSNLFQALAAVWLATRDEKAVSSAAEVISGYLPNFGATIKVSEFIQKVALLEKGSINEAIDRLSELRGQSENVVKRVGLSSHGNKSIRKLRIPSAVFNLKAMSKSESITFAQALVRLDTIMTSMLFPGTVMRLDEDTFKKTVDGFARFPDNVETLRDILLAVVQTSPHGSEQAIRQADARISKAFNNILDTLEPDLFSNLYEMEKKDPTQYTTMKNLIAQASDDKEQLIFLLRNHKAIFRELANHYGIEHFERYNWRLVRHLFEGIGRKPKRPLALMIYAKSDWNGAFTVHRGALDKILDHFDARLIEAGSDTELKKRVEGMSLRYGKSDLLYVAGHGWVRGIELSKSSLPVGSRTIDLLDSDVFSLMSKVTNKGVDIVLDSCSTGQPTRVIPSIAGRLSKFIDGVIHAPSSPSFISDIQFEYVNGKPKVSKIEFSKSEHARYARSSQ